MCTKIYMWFIERFVSAVLSISLQVSLKLEADGLCSYDIYFPEHQRGLICSLIIPIIFTNKQERAHKVYK